MHLCKRLRDGGRYTTDDIKSTEGDVREGIEGSFANPLLHLICHDQCLFIKNLEEVIQDAEVEGWGEKLASRVPFAPCAGVTYTYIEIGLQL